MHASGRLQDRVAIVTGSGQGIGRGIALAMAREGALVTVAERNEKTGRVVAQELGEIGAPGLFVQCDVTRRDDVRRVVTTTVEERGGIDILVNNAHDLRDLARPLIETDEEHLRRNLDSGFMGTYYFMQECYPYLKERRGNVINTGSMAGIAGRESLFSYAVTKEAIRAATRVAAREWGRDGIRVNALCPAAIDTPQMQAFATPEWQERMTPQQILGRHGTIDDAVRAAIFLASDDAGFITGHSLMADGGSVIDAAR
jgi:NAD(P)-dependent dehydrogenase (short-subunit alcohol dehydrogenase family)